jgi:polyisoprenoid-binding protein YceI
MVFLHSAFAESATAKPPLLHLLTPAEPRAVLPEGAWTVDRATTTVAVSVGDSCISKVRGETRDVESVLAVEADGSLWTRAGASVASIETAIRMGDHHLGAASFLDAERYPRAELRSRRARQFDGGRLAIEVELNLPGISRPLSLVASILRPEPADGGEVARIRITARSRCGFHTSGAGTKPR